MRNYDPNKVPAENNRLTLADQAANGGTAAAYQWPATQEEIIARTLANANQMVQDAQAGLGEYIPLSSVGAPGGVAQLDANGLPMQAARDVRAYGAFPAATAADNVTAIQAALDAGGLVIFSVPGTYEINAGLQIGNDTTIIATPGVTLKKVAAFDHVLVNAAAGTTTRNRNIHIDGLRIECNGFPTVATFPKAYGLQGQIALMRVDDFSLKNVRIDDIAVNFFAVHLAGCTRGLIEGCFLAGRKDGIHINACSKLTLRRNYTSTEDDGIAMVGADYPTSTPLLGDIEDILIEDHVDDNALFTGGSRGILIALGSWAAWASGNSYIFADPVVNAGNIYRKVSSGTQVSTVAPTHTSGEVTGADGVTWRWYQAGTITESNVRNVTIRRFKHRASTRMVFVTADGDAFNRCEYPGTQGNARFSGIVIESPDTAYSAGFELVKFDAGTTDDLTIRGFRQRSDASMVSTLFTLESSATVKNLVLEDFQIMSTPLNAVQSAPLILADSSGSVVENLKVSRWNFIGRNNGVAYTGTARPFIQDRTASLRNVVVSDCSFEWLQSAVLDLNSQANYLFTGCRFGKHKSLIGITNGATGGTSISVTFAGCSFASPDDNALVFNLTASTTLRAVFSGSITSYSGNVNFAGTGTVVIPYSDIRVNTAGSGLVGALGDLVKTSTGWQEHNGTTWGVIRNA